MAENSREVVKRCLTFQSPERVPINIWALPWIFNHYPLEAGKIMEDYPSDIVNAPACAPSRPDAGDPYKIGRYVDDWGCVFENINAGIHGEIKDPILLDPADYKNICPPYQNIPGASNEAEQIKKINAFCASTDKFVLAGCCPRPWERYQFIRGTENAMIDMMTRDEGVDELLQMIFEFYCAELKFWAKTNIDGLMFMDDWGTQKSLLIPPQIWRNIFKPMYKKFCLIGREAGKFIFMHSDGFIEEIYPDLVEIGVNAMNSQLFCMNMDNLASIAKGKMTFWGELDRQHALCGNAEDAKSAVRKVIEKLYMPQGGVFCQFEMGPGTTMEAARAACEEWAKMRIQQE